MAALQAKIVKPIGFNKLKAEPIVKNAFALKLSADAMIFEIRRVSNGAVANL